MIEISILYIILLLLAYITILFYIRHRINKDEGFGSSTGGALTQLTAKGPQDAYLNGGYENNIYEFGGIISSYYPFGENLWNNPTRTRSYYWPYLYYYPNDCPWYYIYA